MQLTLFLSGVTQTCLLACAAHPALPLPAQLTLFLFGDAHRDHYKESEGAVLLITAPEAKLEEGRLSLSTREAACLAPLGTSQDFAHCAGTTKVSTFSMVAEACCCG